MRVITFGIGETLRRRGRHFLTRPIVGENTHTHTNDTTRVSGSEGRYFQNIDDFDRSRKQTSTFEKRFYTRSLVSTFISR